MEQQPSDKKKKRRDESATDFRIREFMDVRRLRKAYSAQGDAPVPTEPTDIPSPEEDEEDFGLKRSTLDEALRFLRESLEDNCGEDELTEFLNAD